MSLTHSRIVKSIAGLAFKSKADHVFRGGEEICPTVAVAVHDCSHDYPLNTCCPKDFPLDIIFRERGQRTADKAFVPVLSLALELFGYGVHEEPVRIQDGLFRLAPGVFVETHYPKTPSGHYLTVIEIKDAPSLPSS